MHEVILFYGPRHSGKTAYYWQELSSTHARVSAEEIYRKKPSANLHVIIKQFINTLKQKRCVVVDDENWSADTRASYIRAVNKQEFAGDCRIFCYEFSPYHGKQQCLWAALWSLASEEAGLISHTCRTAHTNKSNPSTVSISNCHIPDYVNITRSFTPDSSTKPSKTEGFTEIYNVESHLMCISQHEFTIPALLIQWECLVGVAGSALIEACHHWQTINVAGRIIVVCNNQDNNWKEDLQLVCKLLEKHTLLVIYYIIFTGSLSHMIGWLQYRHTIALHHSATVYVWSSETHRDCARNLGIVNMNVDHITSKPKTINCIRHNTDGPPLMLKDMVYCHPDSQTKDMTKNYQLPLFELAHMLHQYDDTPVNTLSLIFEGKKKQCAIKSDSSGLGWYHVISDMDNYCTHGLLYNSWTGLCQYQRHTVDKIVMVTDKDCSVCFVKKSWDDIVKEKEKKKPSTSCLSSPFVSAKKKHKPSIGLLSPRNSRSHSKGRTSSPVISHEGVLSYAADSSTYARAEAYQDNVFDVNCALNEDDEFVVSCQCHGTGVNPYKSECKLSSSGVIVGSNCSCPIETGNYGRCKHIIAMLLVFMKQQMSKIAQQTPAVTTAETLDKEEGGGILTKNRSLPKWVSEMLPPTEDERPSVKRRKRNSGDDETSNKQTHYKMTDKDLMKTASEILEKTGDIIINTEQQSLVIPSTVDDQQPSKSSDGFPGCHGNNEECIMSQTEDDDLTQEMDQPADNDDIDVMGERIQSSLFYGEGSADSLPSTLDDKPPTDNCDLLDELFS